MKIRLELTQFKSILKDKIGHKGQTLVEFVLLLAVISMLSYGFVSIMNRNIGAYWEHAVNLIIHDEPGGKTAQIE